MYSQVSDVQRLIKWITFSSSSKLTNDDIESMIKEADAVIDAKIGRIYNVPVTDSNDQIILTYASARLAAYEAAKVLIVQAGGDLPAIVEGWKNSADSYIASILNSDLTLENTAKRTATSGIYNYTSQPEAPDRIWELDKEQW